MVWTNGNNVEVAPKDNNQQPVKAAVVAPDAVEDDLPF